MHRLLLWSERSHDVADHEDNRRKKFREVPTGRASEVDTLAVKVGYAKTQRHFAECTLILRAFHKRTVEPCCSKLYRDQNKQGGHRATDRVGGVRTRAVPH